MNVYTSNLFSVFMTHLLADEAGKVGGDVVHLGDEIAIKLFPELKAGCCDVNSSIACVVFVHLSTSQYPTC